MVKHYCGRWAWWNATKKELSPFFCGHGGCERQVCRKMFWQRRVTLVGDLVRQYQLTKFYTLTVTRDKCTLEESWKSIAKTWDNCRHGLKRDYPDFLYVSVLEEHKDGYPHIHGFTNTWIAQGEWSDRWSACGGGPIVWVEAVKNDISEYVSKQWNVAHYVGKQAICGPKERMVRRTLWRSIGMKTAIELSKRSEDLYQIIKGHVFDDGEERLHGKTERIRQDLERTCGPSAEESIDAGSENVETEGPAS